VPAPLALSVIVPARNAAATIGRTLDALARQDFDLPYEVIVVDDGSADATAAIAASAPGPVRVLRQGGLGPGQARHLGAKRARGEVLAFTDADCLPQPEWLRAGMRALEDADLVQGAVRPERGVPLRPFDHTIWVTGESGLYESANLFIRRELYERVGGFEDWLAVGIGKRLGEDVWLGWKVRRAGARTAFCPQAIVEHAVIARRWHEFVAERIRLVYFPSLVRRIPELRRAFLLHRVFLTRRSAAFDVALGGALCAAVLAALAFPVWTVAILAPAISPYAFTLARAVRFQGRYAVKVALVQLVADAVGFAALLFGSVRARTVVL